MKHLLHKIDDIFLPIKWDMSCFFITVFKNLYRVILWMRYLHAFSLSGAIQEYLFNRTKEKNEFSLKIHMKREAIKSLPLKPI